MITQMLEQFSHQMGGRRISIFPGNKASSPHKLFGSSRPRSSGDKEAALRMHEFYKGGNTPYEESLKRVLLRLSCPKNASILVFGSWPKQRYILTLFGKTTGPGEKTNRHSQEMRQDFLQRNTYPPLGDKRQGDSGVEFKPKTRQPGVGSRENSILLGVML